MTEAPDGPDRASKYPELPLMLRGCSRAGAVVVGDGVVVAGVAEAVVGVAVWGADAAATGDACSAMGGAYKLVCEVIPVDFFPNGE